MIILEGDIQTGKTTALLRWVKMRKDIGGFLTPQIDGSRNLYDIEMDCYYKFEINSPMAGNEEIINVGKFSFLKTGFQIASDIIISSLNNSNIKYIVIDEIGKLELRNQGHHDVLEDLLNQSSLIKQVILVVRSSLLKEVINHYQILDYKLIKKEDLSSL